MTLEERNLRLNALKLRKQKHRDEGHQLDYELEMLNREFAFPTWDDLLKVEMPQTMSVSCDEEMRNKL